VERDHRSDNSECPQVERPRTTEEVRAVTAADKAHDNQQRPNQALRYGKRLPRVAFPTLPARPPIPLIVDPDAWLQTIDGCSFVRRVQRNGSVTVDDAVAIALALMGAAWRPGGPGDTPGIGSIHDHNTATTYAFLPEADATIFVTSAESPLAETELAFFDALRQHVRMMFFVLNKVDQVSQAEQTELASFTTQELAERLGDAGVRLFLVSAREVLLAKAAGDGEHLAASGLPALEAALATFLTAARGAVLLTALLDRALRLVDEARFVRGLGGGQRPSSRHGRAHRGRGA
jgi:hypothetical protein